MIKIKHLQKCALRLSEHNEICTIFYFENVSLLYKVIGFHFTRTDFFICNLSELFELIADSIENGLKVIRRSNGVLHIRPYARSFVE